MFPLHYACNIAAYGAFPLTPSPLDVVNELLAAGFDPNQPDSFGRTPLHWAALMLDWELFSMLVAKGADLHARSLVAEKRDRES